MINFFAVYLAVSYCLTVRRLSSMVLFTMVFTELTKKLREAKSCWPFLVRFL